MIGKPRKKQEELFSFSSIIENSVFDDQVFQSLELDEGAIISSKEFTGCEFRHCRLSHLSLIQCRFENCRFFNCDLSLTNLNQSSFQDVEFTECKLLGINWVLGSSLFFSASFLKSYLDNSAFTGMSLVGTSFCDCRMREVDFAEADLGRADFSGSDLGGSLFFNTNLSKADFRSASSYAFDPQQNIVKKARFSIPEVIGLLKPFDILIDS